MSNKLHTTRAFRADPRDYDQAQEHLSARGRTMQDYLEAAVRWASTEPDRALVALAPAWPPARFSGRPTVAIAYAVRDEAQNWHGQPGLLPQGLFVDAPAEHLFEPADLDNPWYGERFVFRCADVTGVLHDEEISPYAVRVRTSDDERGNGRLVAVRMTHQVQDVLFGPRLTTGPAWTEWCARRRARAQQRAAPSK